MLTHGMGSTPPPPPRLLFETGVSFTISKFNIAVKVDLVEVFYCLKQIFHLLYDKSVAPAEALLYFSLVV